MHSRCLPYAAAAFLAVASAPAAAQSCVGFTDVPAASPLCGNLEWLKNRSITGGCTATTYCPDAAVTRLSMAAFLARMGDRLTPTILTPVPKVDSIQQLDLATPKVVCPTGDYAIPVAGQALAYPRRAVFSGRVNLYNPSAHGDFVVEMVYSVVDAPGPGSTNWVAVQDTAAYQTLYTGFTPAHDVTTYPQGFLDLDVGKVYRFAMRISRYTGSTANVAAYCANFVRIENRNGTSSPFDEGLYAPAADAPPLEGRALPRP